jgi:hypothetical protein
MKTKLAITAFIFLMGCASVTLPPGQEQQKTFAQETSLDYREAYRIIARQMRACYRGILFFGIGYDVQADMDTAERTARVELYHVGPTGASTNPEDSSVSRTVTIKAREGGGATIITTGTTPKYVFMNHLAVKSWLLGGNSCGAGNQTE